MDSSPELAKLLHRLLALDPLNRDARRISDAVSGPMELQWRYLHVGTRNLHPDIDLDDQGRDELHAIWQAAAEIHTAYPHLHSDGSPQRESADHVVDRAPSHRRLHELRTEIDRIDAQRPRLIAERDEIIRTLVADDGYEQARVAFAAGVSRQRLSQIVRTGGGG